MARMTDVRLLLAALLLTVPLGRSAADYQGPAHYDTCDGNYDAPYKCPKGLVKTCVDVRRGADIPACSRSPFRAPSNKNDTCPGKDREHEYGPCPPDKCVDVAYFRDYGYKGPKWRFVEPRPSIKTHVDITVKCVMEVSGQPPAAPLPKTRR